MSRLTESAEWQALAGHAEATAGASMRELFAADPDRARRFSLEHEGLLLDYSKHRITEETLGLLFELVRSAGVEGWRDRMFAGEKINMTEDRAVLHMALRNRSDSADRWSTARTSCRTVDAVLEPHARLLRRGARRRVARPYRASRSPTSSISASAARTSAR